MQEFLRMNSVKGIIQVWYSQNIYTNVKWMDVCVKTIWSHVYITKNS